MIDDMRFVPPQNIEAEMSVLGGIMVDNSAIDKVLGLISVDDFYRESHRKILQAMSRLSEASEPCDLITLSNELKKSGYLEEAGGGAYLYQLVEYVPTAANIAYYCKAVAEAALMRKLLLCGQDMIKHVKENKPPGEIIESVVSDMLKITINQKKEPSTAKDLARDTVRRLEQRFENKGKFTGIPYGWESLDKATNGMHGGDLIIVAGRPSMGKSAFAANIAENVCELDYSALIFSLEMAKEQLTERHFSSIGNIDFGRVRSGYFQDADWSKLMTAAGRFNEYNLAIDDTPGISLHEIRAKSRMRKAKYGLDLIIIDYLQLMSTSNNPSRVQAIGEISRGLKQLARELNIPVVALSQLNRGVDSRSDKKPAMSDLRDSGEIEQDADVILFPFRPAVYCDKCKKKEDTSDHEYELHQSEAVIMIAKQRNGESNIDIPVAWRGRHQKFKNLNQDIF